MKEKSSNLLDNSGNYVQDADQIARTVLLTTPSPQLIQTIETLTAGHRPYIKTVFKEVVTANPENASILCDFLLVERTECNIAATTMEWKTKVMIWLSKFFEHKKSYRQMTKQDILLYLNKLRRPEEQEPMHKWIGSYNNRVMMFGKFFHWLYNPDEPDHRKRPTPPVMNGVKQLKRKEKSPYKPSDLWIPEEHGMFLKYCPSKRNRAYPAMANDTSARPHELRGLRIRDVMFKLAPDGRQYAEVLVSGKTKQRTLPLISSIPYVKEWIQDHPQVENPNAFLFVSLAPQTLGRKMNSVNIWDQYADQYKRKYFPNLLKDTSVPPKDRGVIKRTMDKPRNPYVQRHTALTQKSQILKESTLRDHAGWTMTYFKDAKRVPALLWHRVVKQYLGSVRHCKNDRPAKGAGIVAKAVSKLRRVK